MAQSVSARPWCKKYSVRFPDHADHAHHACFDFFPFSVAQVALSTRKMEH